MKPTAILTADIHLRDDVPECRIDNFWEAQSCKIAFLRSLQDKYGCAILDGGDLLNKCRSSQFLEAWAILNLPKIITIPGTHDLPNHNIDLLEKSSLSVLGAGGVLEILSQKHNPFKIVGTKMVVVGFAWEEKFELKSDENGGYMVRGSAKKIALIHSLTYKKELPWPDAEASMAKRLLRAHPEFDLIVAGHNHWPFVEKYKGRLLVSPGCMTRQHADQENLKPRCYLWYAGNNEVKPVYYPTESGIISREHIEQKQNHDERLTAFIKRMKDDYEIGLSFMANLESFLKKNKVKEETKKIIWEAIEGG